MNVSDKKQSPMFHHEQNTTSVPSTAAQEDVFSAPPVMPPAVKPVEKTRPSIFQFVTGRRSVEEKKVENPSRNDDDSDIPSFLRQR